MKIFLILSIFASSCGGLMVDESTDEPKPIVVKNATCESVYKNLYNLCQADSVKNAFCCETIEPTKTGVTFQNFCKEVMSEGVDLNLSCLSTITSCGQINVCTKSE